MTIVLGFGAVIIILRQFWENVIPEKLYRNVIAWLLFIFLWEFSLYTGIFKSILLAPPTVILSKALFYLEKGYLQLSIASTLKRFTAGFLIAIVAAVPLGIFIGLHRKLYEWLSPALNFFRMIPTPAILPFAIVVLGIGERPAIFVIALGSFFPIFLNTVQGVKEAETIHCEVVRTMGGSQWDIVKHVIVPSATPTVLTGIRIGFGIGWLVLISAEIVAADSGLGYMMEGARNRLDTPTVFVGMVVVCVLGMAIDIFLKIAEKFFVTRKGGGYITYGEISKKYNDSAVSKRVEAECGTKK